MNKSWNCAGIYADEGKAATGTKFRDSFNDMIEDCYAGKIDMILTKSISRFARNTVDCLRIIRELKKRQIRILFEKENIDTMDNTGELLITIFILKVSRAAAGVDVGVASAVTEAVFTMVPGAVNSLVPRLAP